MNNKISMPLYMYSILGGLVLSFALLTIRLVLSFGATTAEELTPSVRTSEVQGAIA